MISHLMTDGFLHTSVCSSMPCYVEPWQLVCERKLAGYELQCWPTTNLNPIELWSEGSYLLWGFIQLFQMNNCSPASGHGVRNVVELSFSIYISFESCSQTWHPGLVLQCSMAVLLDFCSTVQYTAELGPEALVFILTALAGGELQHERQPCPWKNIIARQFRTNQCSTTKHMLKSASNKPTPLNTSKENIVLLIFVLPCLLHALVNASSAAKY